MTSASPRPDVSIVIVSFNTLNVLRECLQSIERESDGLDVEIWVVDNNSSDGSPEMIEQEFLRAHHVADRDERKFDPVGAARDGVERRRDRGALATAEDIRAHDEEAVRVDGLAGADEIVPPAGLLVVR